MTGYIGNRGAQKVGGEYFFLYGSWQTANNPGHFKGKFNYYVGELGKIHLQQQARFQDLVVANIKADIKRKASTTGRLVQVTADSRNRLIGGTGAHPSALSGAQGAAFGWGVGNTPFLDVSVAKYWRTIEEGSAAVWKRPFAGELRTKDKQPLWGWFGAGAFLAGDRALASGPYSAPDKGSDQGKFRPWYVENKSGQRTFPPREHSRGLLIKHEIAPMHAYLKAWRTVEKDVFLGWEQAWQATFGRGVPNRRERLLATPNLSLPR